VSRSGSRYQFGPEYVERLVAGDPDTQQHFADYFRTLLALKVRARLRSPGIADDAVQETLARVLAALKRGSLENPAGLGAFVNSVCNNVLFELYRSVSRTTPLEDDHDRADDRIASVESKMVAGDERARVRRALAKLPQKERDLLRWLFFEERNKDDVCRMLNVDRGYLRVLLHRAKAKFRDRLAETAPSSSNPTS
jgi:RNA polymerase sigma-70 factor (ECF subfamily)